MALTTALDTLESMVHKECGQYTDLAFDPDTDGWWEIDAETVCYACAAVAEWRDNDGAKHLDKGALPYVRLDPDFRPKRRGKS